MEVFFLAISKMTYLDKITHIITVIGIIYSVSLAGFRHSVHEDLGIFDSISEVLKFTTLFTVAVKNQELRLFDRQV